VPATEVWGYTATAPHISTWTAWNTDWVSTGTLTTATYIVVNTPNPWAFWNTTWTTTLPTRDDFALVDSRTNDEIVNQQRARIEAKARAEELLRSCLTSHQREQMDESGCFPVAGSDGGLFLIYTDRGTSGNVTELFDEDDGLVEIARWCAHPPDGLPQADIFLAQKLALETDEMNFRLVANCHWSRERRSARMPEVA